jgi:DNA-binding response OmpR family regulator
MTTSANILHIDGQRVGLTGTELSVFAALFNARGRCIAKDELYRAVYGTPAGGGPFDKILDHWIMKLRAKLALTGFRIITVHSAGWRLNRSWAAEFRAPARNSYTRRDWLLGSRSSHYARAAA